MWLGGGMAGLSTAGGVMRTGIKCRCACHLSQQRLQQRGVVRQHALHGLWRQQHRQHLGRELSFTRRSSREEPRAGSEEDNSDAKWKESETLPKASVAVQQAVDEGSQKAQEAVGEGSQKVDKKLTSFSRQAAGTFAPRPSGAVKNPATKGTWLYAVFQWQAWLSLVVGGLLSYNIIFPSDKPSIARLMGMWSIWMFTVPSLRARECAPNEKDALNLLFVLLPLVNVALPFVWKSFGFIFTADVFLLVGIFLWKDAFKEGLLSVDGTSNTDS